MTSARSVFRIAPICLGLYSAIALAANAEQKVVVAGLLAKQTCIKEDIRITGFAAAREEATASLVSPGYRVSEILVSEGDKVAPNQEIMRAVREGASDALSAGTNKGVNGAGGAISLRAPIAGIVVKINARVGDITGVSSTGSARPASILAAQGGQGQPDPQFLISAGNSVDLIVDIPSLYMAQVRKGAIARVVSDEGVEAKGVVQSPASDVDAASQLGRGRLSIEPASALRSGQFASAIIETARDCGVTVPHSAISYRNGEPIVQILHNSSVENRSVRTGLSDGVKVRIREGLSEGEVVAIHAGTALRPGDKITPIVKEIKLRNEGM